MSLYTEEDRSLNTEIKHKPPHKKKSTSFLIHKLSVRRTLRIELRLFPRRQRKKKRSTGTSRQYAKSMSIQTGLLSSQPRNLETINRREKDVIPHVAGESEKLRTVISKHHMLLCFKHQVHPEDKTKKLECTDLYICVNSVSIDACM